MSSTSLLNTKCSICGAPLVFPAGKDEVFCEFCLRPNARPKSEANETTLMKYANERRNIGEFDEAEDAYRQVLQKNIDEHEARWGLLLCKYGAMYVEDAASGERLLTCRKAVGTLMRAEPDFRICCEQAGDAVRASYEKDAAYIDAVQAEIRRIRTQEKPYDVFICYKETKPGGGRTDDSVIAQGICARMTARGFRMFYAPESLKLKSGANYEAAIFAALSDARVMLMLGTKPEFFESTWVRSEWKRYLEMIDAGEEKLLVPMYRGLDPGIDLPMEFRMRYLNAMNMDDVGYLYDLEALLNKVFKRRGDTKSPEDVLFDRRDLLNAMFMVQDGEFEEAVEALRAIIKRKPDCAEAHLGLCMARARVRNEEDLPGLQTSLKKSNDFKRAVEFAGEEMRARLKQYVEVQKARFEREKAEREEKEKAEREAKERAEREAREKAEREAKEKAERGAGEKTGQKAEAGSADSSTSAAGAEQDEPLPEVNIDDLKRDARKGDIDAAFTLATMYDGGNGVPEDKKQAIGWYRMAAKHGHAQSQYRLGRMYAGGEGVPVDRDAALKWCRLAAQNGHAAAQNDLGQIYKRGDGVRKSLSDALRLFKLAAAQGYAEAEYNLGYLYDTGEGIGQDKGEALRLYRLAADQGHAEAQYQLGFVYYEGKNVPRDLEEAIRWFNLSARQDYAPAQYRVGAMLSNGEGVNKNEAEALRLLSIAAGKGIVDAQCALGDLYCRGEDIDRNVKEAVRWYRKAANQKHTMALYHLGDMYFSGIGVAKDFNEAFKLLHTASEQGSALAKCRIGDLFLKGEGRMRDRTEAARWYRQAAEQGCAQAQYNLAVLYYNGIGMIKDRIGAVRMLKLAANQGHADSLLMLGDLYYRGDGVPQNRTEAAKYYRVAAQMGDSRGKYTLGTMLYLGDGTERNRDEGLVWLREAVKDGDKRALRFLTDHHESTKIQQTPNGPEIRETSTAGSARKGMIQEDWSRIITAIADGSARQRYKVGECKTVLLAGVGEVAMQLVGFELDDRSDGKGKAATTWIARDVLPQGMRMNPKINSEGSRYQKGTGAIGGWEKCELRRYFDTVLTQALPEELRNSIVMVQKRHAACNASGYPMQQKTWDKLWIPAFEEIYGANPLYAGLSVGGSDNGQCWLRSAASGGDGFQTDLGNGETGIQWAEEMLGVRIGFCL